MSDEASLKLGFDLSTLDILLDSFARSGKDSSIERGPFYADINRKMVASTHSIASAIWVKSSSGQIRSVHQVGWVEIPVDQRKLLQDLVRDLLSVKQPTASKDLTNHKAFSGVSTTLSGLTFAYLLVRPSSESEIVDQIFEDLTGEIATQIETFENARANTHRVKSERDLTHIAQMVQNLGKSDSLQQMAFHLVNDLAKITDASRVTYVNNSGKVLAISGVSQVSLRTSVARDLSRVAKSTIRYGSPFEWTDGEVIDDGQILPRAVQQVIADLPSPSGFAFPIGGEGPPCGALLLEYFPDPAAGATGPMLEQQQLGIEQRELINETIQFSSPVIERNFRLFSIPAIGGMDLLFNRLMVKPVRLLGWLCLTGLIFVLACYGLFFVERPFEIYGEGVLHPAQQQHVFSQVEGEVVQLLVEEGANVKQGQMLVTIASKSLEKELIAIEGEIGEARQELRNLTLADSDKATGSDIADNETQKASDIERLKIRLESLNAQLEVFENKKSQLTVEAPISGQVTTPELRQRLTTRPIDRGDLLITIAEVDGQWEVELKIPDNRISFINQAIQKADDQPLNVEFRLASASERTYYGQLSGIDFRSDLRSEQEESMVITEIAIDESELGDSLRIGARVYGKIVCGKRSNFFLLTYEIRNRLRQWWF